MMNYEEIIRLRRQAAQRDFEASLIPGMTGAWVNGTLVASDDAGTIFVRMGAVTQDDLRPAVKATNAVVDTDVNIPVFLWYVNGVLDIYSINSQLAKEKFGAAVGNKATPRRAGDLSQEWVTGRNLKPGRVYIRAGALEAGMMEVTAGEFDYIDTNGDPKKWRSFPDSAALDISGSEPGSGEGRWVRITFDPDATSPTLVANDGTAMLPELLTPENANDIAIPDGHLTLDFYKYLEGDTPYNLADESRWLFGRHLFNGGSGAISVTDGTTTVNPATAMEFDDNFVVTDAGGGIAQIAGPSGGATFWGKKLVYHMTLGSDDEFDTNDTDQVGRSGLPSTGTNLYGMIVGRNSTNNNRDVYMFANNDTTQTNYSNQYVNATSTTVSGARADTAAIGSAVTGAVTFPSIITFIIPLFRETNFQKSAKSSIARRDGASTQAVTEISWSWENTAAITRLIFRTATDTSFESGSQLFLWTDGDISVGAADLDIAAISPQTPVVGDYLPFGDVSNSENTAKATIGDVLDLANARTQTLTNKTIDGDDNTLQDISPASLKGAPAVVQGDLLYGSGAATLARLAKDTNATRYLANTGGSNNPAWAQINLANGVTGLLKALNACDTITTTSSGNVDNFAIGDAPVVYVRFNNATAATLRGIAGSGVSGQVCVIDSVGAGNVLLAHQNSGSTAANRLINYVTGMDTPLAAALGRAVFVYDATTQRWKMVSHNQGAAITYTPTWTSTGTNPTPGNSTLTGNYLINGNLIMGDFTFTYGSSGVSSGTGVWLFSLPTAVSLQGGGGSANDAGVAGYSVTAARNSSTTVALSAAAAQVTGNNPFTWGSTDNIRLAWFGVAT